MAIYMGKVKVSGSGSGGGSSTISCKFSETAISGIVEANNESINNLLTANNESINNLLTANNESINNLLTANNENVNNLLTANNDTISSMMSSVVDTSITQKSFGIPLIGGGNIRNYALSSFENAMFQETLSSDTLLTIYVVNSIYCCQQSGIYVNGQLVAIYGEVKGSFTQTSAPSNYIPFSIGIKRGSRVSIMQFDTSTIKDHCITLCDI